MLEFNALVIGQDLPIVSSQRPEELPYDLSAELHIKGVDRVSLEYRKWLVQLTDRLVPPSSRVP
jgi:vanillate O-demethylase monooxygenase subunit